MLDERSYKRRGHHKSISGTIFSINPRMFYGE
jgi:hypothetical protein